MKFTYKIVSAPTIKELQTEVQAQINNGFLPVSPLQFLNKEYVLEMTREIPEMTSEEDWERRMAVDEAFQKRYFACPERIRELLEINGIGVDCVNGEFFTTFGDERRQGITPSYVLALVKKSGHYPIDLNESEFLDEIGKLTR